MNFGDSELIRNEGNIRLLKIGAGGDREVYAVLGGGSTKHFEDYEDALVEFNLRWIKKELENNYYGTKLGLRRIIKSGKNGGWT